jgi:hypothetical protein
MLSGYKTYITAFVGIVTEVGLYLTGDVTLSAAIPVVVTCLLGAFIRHGVTTSS